MGACPTAAESSRSTPLPEGRKTMALSTNALIVSTDTGAAAIVLAILQIRDHWARPAHQGGTRQHFRRRRSHGLHDDEGGGSSPAHRARGTPGPRAGGPRPERRDPRSALVPVRELSLLIEVRVKAVAGRRTPQADPPRRPTPGRPSSARSPPPILAHEREPPQAAEIVGVRHLREGGDHGALAHRRDYPVDLAHRFNGSDDRFRYSDLSRLACAASMRGLGPRKVYAAG